MHPETDARLLQTLANSGSQSIDTLTLLSALSWSQVFLAVDRLSRRGRVRVSRSGSGEYEVALGHQRYPA